MTSYRLFCFDGASRIVGSDFVTARDDTDALNQARRKIIGTRGEVWERDRLVARIAAPRLS